MDWSKLKGEYISILLEGKDGKEENYIGIVASVDDGFLELDTSGINTVIDMLVCRFALIKSIWVYKEKQYHNGLSSRRRKDRL